MTSQIIQEQVKEGQTDDLNEIFSSLIASGIQMKNLINNLLDFTRTRFGQALPINPELTDLGSVCRQTAAEVGAAYPGRTIVNKLPRDLHGVFDDTRIGEMLSNLIANAAQHGSETTPVKVAARLESEEIVLQVHNEGPPIPPILLSTIFDPWIKSPPQTMKKNRHQGLGL